MPAQISIIFFIRVTHVERIFIYSLYYNYYLAHIHNFIHRAVMISINLKNIGWAAKITVIVKNKYKVEMACISIKLKGWDYIVCSLYLK